MKRPHWFTIGVILLLLCTVRILVSSPGSVADALFYPFRALFGTSHELNARLLEVSESPDTIRAAGQRLLQPLGAVKVLRIYEFSAESERKTDPHTH